MWRSAAILVAALGAAAPAYADTPVPQPDTPCPANLAGATTMPPAQSLPLLCDNLRWQAMTAPADPSDRWVGLGPAMALHGEGLRNPNLASGTWTATPLNPETRCSATQHAVVSAGVVGPPIVDEGQPGQPLTVAVAPRLFDITMTGHCLWVRTG